MPESKSPPADRPGGKQPGSTGRGARDHWWWELLRRSSQLPHARNPILVQDLEGTVLDLDEAAAHALGWSQEELLGQPAKKLVPPEWHERADDLRARCRRGETVRDAEGMRWTPEGERIPSLITLVPLNDPQGELAAIATLTRDVSEIRKLEEMLGEIEKHFGLMVWLYDTGSGVLLYASESYEAISGRPSQSLYEDPASWMAAIVPEDRARVEAAFAELLEGRVYDQEFRISRPDGALRWVRSRASAVRDSLGRVFHVAGVSEDVTAQRELLRLLRGALLAAEAAEETERQNLAADLHDSVGQTLPLVRIKLAALLDELGHSPLRESTEELASLLAETEEQIRGATFRLSPISVAELGLAPALQRLAEVLSLRYGLRVSVHDDGLPKPLDDARGHALLRGTRELLINVARHAKTDKAEVRIAREGESIGVTVEDGGIGFDAAAERPTGFGLLSLRDRVEGLGGSLQIESKPRRGTRARIVLPASGTGAG